MRGLVIEVKENSMYSVQVRDSVVALISPDLLTVGRYVFIEETVCYLTPSTNRVMGANGIAPASSVVL